MLTTPGLQLTIRSSLPGAPLCARYWPTPDGSGDRPKCHINEHGLSTFVKMTLGYADIRFNLAEQRARPLTLFGALTTLPPKRPSGARPAVGYLKSDKKQSLLAF